MLAGLAHAGRASADPFLLPSEKQGSWTASDKELHFASALAISASFRAADRSQAASFGIAVGVGTLKELFDGAVRGRGASWKDLVVDIAGAAAGFLIVDALDR